MYSKLKSFDMKFVHFTYKNKILYIKKKNKKQLLFSNFKITILYLFSFIFIILFILYPFFKNLIILNNKKLLNNGINTILNNINKNIILCQKGILINDNFKSISNPLITVIISVYNSEKTIKAAIRSVQNQNFRDIWKCLKRDGTKKRGTNSPFMA